MQQNTKLKKRTVYVEPDIHRRVEILAQHRGQSYSEFVRNAVRQHFREIDYVLEQTA